MEKTKDYHDYVIKDGKFVGAFEEMYQNVEDPWHQTEEAAHSYSRMDTVNSIRRFHLGTVLEAGCGLGHFTNYLQAHCPSSKIIGMDIAPTAIEKAKASFPKLSFIAGNLKDLDAILASHGFAPDGIVFSEIMWYILQDLDVILEKTKKALLSTGGVLLINQVFYHGGQRYGREFFTTQEEMMDYIGWDVLARTRSETADVTSSYETHTVLRPRR